MEQQDNNVLDDPIWEYVLATKLQPYLPAVKRWWENYENIKVLSTGILPIEYDDIEVPPGLMMRMTSTSVRSPIKGVQAFPFVPTGYLQIAGVSGGVARMVERVCAKGFEIDGLKVIEKHNLRTYGKGQMICFIPKDVLDGARELGKYMYLTVQELCSMAKGRLPDTVIAKCYQYIK